MNIPNPDIYVVCGTIGTANAPDHLLLGKAACGFSSPRRQATSPGGRKRVYALDYSRDGLTDFLVLNGQVPTTRPIQLLTPQPVSGPSSRSDTEAAVPTSQRMPRLRP